MPKIGKNKQAFYSFSLAIISANPIITYLCFNNFILTSVLFLFLLIASYIIFGLFGKYRWVSIYFVNFVLLFSVLIHFEVLFRHGFSANIISDLYSPRGKIFFNKSYLSEELNDFEYNSIYRTNSQGFRIGKANSTEQTVTKCDWLFLGDSFTQGAQVNFNQLYTTILNKFFPDKIILNLGISGFGVPEEYKIFREIGKDLRPSKVFLQISPFNDFANVEEKSIGVSDYLMHYSDLLRFLLYRIKFTNRNGLPLKRWSLPFHEQEIDNINYNIFYKKTSEIKERDKKSLLEYIQKMNNEVEKIGAELIIVLMPTKEQLYYIYLREVIENFNIKYNEIDLNFPSKLMAELCRDNNIGFIDLTEEYIYTSRNIFFHTDEHLNQYGHILTAEILAKKLRKNFNVDARVKLLSKKIWGDRYPSFNASGTEVIFQSLVDNNYEIMLTDVDFQKFERLTSNNTEDIHPVISSSNEFILYTQGNQESYMTNVYLMSLKGDILKNITNDPNTFGAIPTFSPNGKFLAYAEWRFDNKLGNYTLPQITYSSIKGEGKAVITQDNYESWRPIFSPDSNSIMYISKRNGNFEIYEYNISTNKEIQLTYTQYDEWDPKYSPNGDKIVFSANKQGNWDLFEMNFDGSNVNQLTSSKGDEWDPSYANDGENIIYAGEFGFVGGIYQIKANERKN